MSHTAVETMQVARPARTLRRPSYRDPRLLVGTLLVAASVTTGARVIAGFENTSPHYAAARALAPGDRLTTADLKVIEVRLGDAAANYLSGELPADGLVVTQRVGAGGLVPVDSVARSGQVGMRPVSLPVTAAVAAGLKEGDVVDVWVAPVDTSRSGAFLKPAIMVQSAQVRSVADSGSALSMSGADHSVNVVVPQARLADLLDAVANSARISLVRVGGRA